MQDDNGAVADFSKSEWPTMLARERTHGGSGRVNHPVDEAHTTSKRKHMLSHAISSSRRDADYVAGCN